MLQNPIDGMSALVQVLAWCMEGDKLLPQPMLTQISVTLAPLGHNELTKFALVHLISPPEKLIST